MPLQRQHKIAGAAFGTAMSLIASFEGCKTYAYRDPVGIPTVCFGETQGVHMGQHYTKQQCEEMLQGRLPTYAAMVDRCIHVPMSDNRRAALISFTWNVGQGTLCKSSLARRLNEGDPDACDSLNQYVYARGIRLPGLVNRRHEEWRYCMS